jgi:hypothetical protein
LCLRWVEKASGMRFLGKHVIDILRQNTTLLSINLRWHTGLKPLLAFSMNSPIFPYIISYMTRNIILGYNKVHFGWEINFGFFGKCGNFEGF